MERLAAIYRQGRLQRTVREEEYQRKKRERRQVAQAEERAEAEPAMGRRMRCSTPFPTDRGQGERQHPHHQEAERVDEECPGTSKPRDGEPRCERADEIRELQAGRGEPIGSLEGGFVHEVRPKGPYPCRGRWRERSGQQRKHEYVPEVQRSLGIERGYCSDKPGPSEIVEADHQPRLVAVQQAPED